MFKVLGIKASPDNQAKRAVERRSMGGEDFMRVLSIWRWIENTH